MIARSAEAKQLGIRMGAPWFEIRDTAERQGVLAYSINPGLYSDMSNRMMNVLKQFSVMQEVYSIDECFLCLDGATHVDLFTYGQQIRQRVGQWLGLPVCVGIAPTKTMAKLANHCAKTGLAGRLGVCDFSQMDQAERDDLFAQLPVSDVWGIGRRLHQKLRADGIHSVAALQGADSRVLSKKYSCVVANIVHELNGISCLACDDVEHGRQQIISSRSFGNSVYSLREMQEAVAHHIALAAGKLRAQGSWATVVHVSIRTSHHATETYYQRDLAVPLRAASQDTLRLTEAALWGLQEIFRPGHAYRKAGIALLNLSSVPPAQSELFAKARSDNPRLMQVLDQINHTFGHGSLRSAATTLHRESRWQARKEYPALGFTTHWADLPRVSAR